MSDTVFTPMGVDQNQSGPATLQFNVTGYTYNPRQDAGRKPNAVVVSDELVHNGPGFCSVAEFSKIICGLTSRAPFKYLIDDILGDYAIVKDNKQTFLNPDFTYSFSPSPPAPSAPSSTGAVSIQAVAGHAVAVNRRRRQSADHDARLPPPLRSPTGASREREMSNDAHRAAPEAPHVLSPSLAARPQPSSEAHQSSTRSANHRPSRGSRRRRQGASSRTGSGALRLVQPAMSQSPTVPVTPHGNESVSVGVLDRSSALSSGRRPSLPVLPEPETLDAHKSPNIQRNGGSPLNRAPQNVSPPWLEADGSALAIEERSTSAMQSEEHIMPHEVSSVLLCANMPLIGRYS